MPQARPAARPTFWWPLSPLASSRGRVPTAASPRSPVYAAAAALILGGAAIHFRRTAKAGAAVLALVYLVFALQCLPGIVAAPRIYNSGATYGKVLFVPVGDRYALYGWQRRRSNQPHSCPGVCAASFALEQAFYLPPTATLVPKWLPPNPMFWAVATTVFFALAAVALLANRMVLLAARLLTIMLLIFGLIVWIPLLLSAPRSHTNWSETVETFAIAGTAWILADLLADYRLNDRVTKVDRPSE